MFLPDPTGKPVPNSISTDSVKFCTTPGYCCANADADTCAAVKPLYGSPELLIGALKFVLNLHPH